MTWQFTDQVQTYARRTWPLLAAAPARNTIALTVIENVLAGHRWSSEAMTFGWFTAGELAVGAICMTPPYELLLAEVPASAIEPLADALLARGTAVKGSTARPPTRRPSLQPGRHAVRLGRWRGGRSVCTS